LILFAIFKFGSIWANLIVLLSHKLEVFSRILLGVYTFNLSFRTPDQVRGRLCCGIWKNI